MTHSIDVITDLMKAYKSHPSRKLSPSCENTFLYCYLSISQLSKSQGRGEILVSLCHQPAANRLTVVVLKAKNLPKMDVTGLAGTFLLCSSFECKFQLNVHIIFLISKRNFGPIFVVFEKRFQSVHFFQ